MFPSEKMESSVDEQLQTAADDSLRSDSIPSLPDEKGNFPCVHVENWRKSDPWDKMEISPLHSHTDSFAFVVLLELSSGPCVC